MNLSSARELRRSIVETELPALSPSAPEAVAEAAAGWGVPAQRMDRIGRIATLAVGIAPGGLGEFRIALRLQHRMFEGSPVIERIVARARGEVDLRYVGRVAKRRTAPSPPAAPPWGQQRQRPLAMGVSVGHYAITAGTLGCFVAPLAGEDAAPRILSNNHVLADENAGRPGDAVLQPGPVDGGTPEQDTVASLERFVALETATPNLVDCAIAPVAPGIDVDPAALHDVGELAGPFAGSPDQVRDVGKVGRTTGWTVGTVTAFELDNVVVSYDLGQLRFDGQIEIEGTTAPFSAGGDSGSLIVTAGDHQAFALLFAGSDTGGANGQGLTFANPLSAVLQQLEARLLP